MGAINSMARLLEMAVLPFGRLDVSRHDERDATRVDHAMPWRLDLVA